ncbi:MAG: hypothetical protein Q9183_003653 [Haloplaca sp. 2 TL-2023]
MGPTKTETQDLAHMRQRLHESKTLYDAEKGRINPKEGEALDVFTRTIVAGGLGLISEEFLSKPWTAEDLVKLWLIFMATDRDAEIERFDNENALKIRGPSSGEGQYPVREFHEYSLTLQRSLRNRTFFITEKGHVGLAPAMVRKRDVVVLIAGLEAPLILRPIPDTPPGLVPYYLLGDCYVDGIMHGKFFQNIDPDEVETMWQSLSIA